MLEWAEMCRDGGGDGGEMVAEIRVMIGCYVETFSFIMSLGWRSVWASSSALRAGALHRGHVRPFPTLGPHDFTQRSWGTILGHVKVPPC